MSVPSDVTVSIVITARNYAKYLATCIESALHQNFDRHEVIIVDDGSSDHTQDVIAGYRDHPRVRAIRLDGVGLAAACNRGIRASRGDYVIRLDADDFFDENILLLESALLDRRPDIGLVYPDYYRVNEHGEMIDHVRLSKVNDEVKLLDRSPLAGGAMFRRSCYDAIGGYSEELKYQEDYDFWIRFIEKFHVYNINLPLLYYRRHEQNMSSNAGPRMEARRYVKQKFVEKRGLQQGKRILCVIPVTAEGRIGGRLATRELAGRPVLAYTLEEARKVPLIERIVVSTEDPEIADVARALGAEAPFLRPRELAKLSVPMEEVLRHTLRVLSREEGYAPDLLTLLHVRSPFRTERHISEAINTLLLYDADSVISVCEDLTFHWRPGEYGLTPVGYQRRSLREDKETIYKENGALYVLKIQNLAVGKLLGKRIGHIEMRADESIRLDTEFDFWVAEHMLKGDWPARREQ